MMISIHLQKTGNLSVDVVNKCEMRREKTVTDELKKEIVQHGRRMKAYPGNVERMEKKANTPLAHKLSHCLPCSAIMLPERRHSPPGTARATGGTYNVCIWNTKVNIFRYSFFQAGMHTTPKRRARGARHRLHFLSQVTLHNAQMAHLVMLALEIVHSQSIFDLTY